MESIEVMSNAAMWAIIVGFIQPVALQFILQTKQSKNVQALIAFAFSIVTGGITAFFTGAFEGLPLVTTILLVAVSSISFYKGFWKNVAGDLKAATSAKPAIEDSPEKGL